MEINNKDLISSFLQFNEDTFYFIQVIQRRKDNPELDKAELQRGFWFIRSLGDLDIHWPKILMLCNTYNARAYISLNPRSLSRLGKLALHNLSERNLKNAWDGVERVMQKIALISETRQEGLLFSKTWIIDLDTDDIKELELIKNSLMCLSDFKIHTIIPTPNGYHLVTGSFNKYGLDSISDYSDKNWNYVISGIPFSVKREANTLLYSNLQKP